MDIATAITTIGIPVVFGLGTWLGKIWSDRIARTEQAQLQRGNDLLKSQLDAERERHRVVFAKHFELEFDLYRRLWQTAIAVAGAAERLRPDGFFWASANEDERKKQERELAEHFDKAQLAFKDTFLAHRPFIPEPLYAACLALLRAALDEFHPYVNLLAHDTPYQKTWREDRASHLATMNAQEALILEEIRKQLVAKERAHALPSGTLIAPK